MLAGPRSLSYQLHHHNPQPEKNTKYIEFKYLYFKLQELIEQRVVLSLRYDILKTPEIHAQITKPLTIAIIDISTQSTLSRKLGSSFTYGSNALRASTTISQDVVFILLLLRYEYIIQSDNNLISFELLSTKAAVCEILAIRMLREYKSNERVDLLFVKPLGDRFNTLELSVLSKSKRFLSQPVIIQTLDKIYNGEITFGQLNEGDSSNEETLLEHKIQSYTFSKITLTLVRARSETVPKYQSLVVNIKLIVFTTLYFVVVMRHKHRVPSVWWVNVSEMLFWFVVLNLNIETMIKLRYIRFKFLRKIIWTYLDLLLLVLLDFALVLKVLMICNPNSNNQGQNVKELFHNMFSIISIVLLPRILSIFNNYEFFNMIILSCKRMVWKMIGLFCLFVSLISGFYISFISLSLNLTSSDILFDMLKVFFGFTPSIWNNWENYNTLGKFTQMGYLFLVQFVIATILAIVLSEVFNKIAATNKEEFNYFKATNLIIYLKTSKTFQSFKPDDQTGSGYYLSLGLFCVNRFMNLFKLPIIVAISLHEAIIAKVYLRNEAAGARLKHFTFLSKAKDYYGDPEMVIEDDWHRKPKKNSMLPDETHHGVAIGAGRKASGFDGGSLAPVQSISTFGNFKSASTDSLFIDEMLYRRYGQAGNGALNTFKTSSDGKKAKTRSHNTSGVNAILHKLCQIENLFDNVTNNNLHPQAPANENFSVADTFKPFDFKSINNIPETSSLDDVDLVTSIESLSD